MLRCAWCMKKINDNNPAIGLNVKFAKGVDYSEQEGTIIQVWLNTRNTSVPMIVTANESAAKNEGTDGVFAICSDKCGVKMEETLTKELTMFKEVDNISLN